MKTILGVLAAASLLFSVNAFAQENANRDANGNVVRGPYETNAFKDNWFVGGGIGLNDGFNTGNSGRIWFFTVPGLGLDAYVGKWLTPEYGVRAIYHGLTNQGFDAWEHFLGGDFLVDLSSAIDGYQETRDWSWIPYVSAGATRYTGGGFGLAVGAGLVVKKYAFLGNENLDMIIDARALASKNDDFPWCNTKPSDYTSGSFGDNLKKVGSKVGNMLSFPLSATWGVAYKFGKQGFKRSASIVPAVVPVPFTTQQYEDLSGKVAELEKENAELKDKIAALEKEVAPLRQLVNGQTYLYDNGTFTAVDAAAGAPVTLYFDCGSTALSAREKAHFEYFAKNVVNENTKLFVNGYADKQTGSAKRNQYLSEQRVKTVVDLLKKAGANEENIESAAHGATVQLFDSAAKNRVVTIEVK
ncbi:MAG: OmpA family protein [Bacteroidales bacterium]|nr:OmpA family protein [Bacteroidales bacterium]